jgi:hypothetical protein
LSHQHRIVSICHGYTALEEQFLDVAKTQLETEIPSNSAADDSSRETVTVIKRFRFFHRAILRDRPNNLTMPAERIHIIINE